MELLMVIVFFVGLAVLALLYGHDSRDALLSSEELLARRGVIWQTGSTRGAPVQTARAPLASNQQSSPRQSRVPTADQPGWRFALLLHRARRRRHTSPPARRPARFRGGHRAHSIPVQRLVPASRGSASAVAIAVSTGVLGVIRRPLDRCS
jgi:hypothetical protein